MDKIFGSKYIRYKFIFTIITLLTLLLLVRFCIFPIDALKDSVNETFVSFIDKFVASVFTAVVVGLFLFWMQLEEKKREIEFTDSGFEIEKYLANGRSSTESWLFNGGLGRYTKSSTIPELSIISSKERRTIAVNIVLLNPFNEILLQKYIAFRISVESENKKKYWTESAVKSEILATIITAFYYKRNNQFLNITVRIKDFFTLTRMDISSSVAVITREDPSIPSIIAKKGSYMYKHYSEEFQQVLRQSQELTYNFSDLDKPEKTEIVNCLKTLFPKENLDSKLIDLVIEKFKNPKNPF